MGCSVSSHASVGAEIYNTLIDEEGDTSWTPNNSVLDNVHIIVDHPRRQRETAPDVLTQLSDAALFGDTPHFITEIVDRMKRVTSNVNLYLGQCNDIDDAGPIKIGNEYYTRNEALQLWRKARESHKASMLRRVSVFDQNNEIEEQYHSNNDEETVETTREGQVGLSINELISRYTLFEKRSKSSVDDSTILAGNVGHSYNKEDGKKDGDKSRLLLSVDECKKKSDKSKSTDSKTGDKSKEERSFSQVDDATADTDNETVSDCSNVEIHFVRSSFNDNESTTIEAASSLLVVE